MSGSRINTGSSRERLARSLRALRAQRGISQEALADLAELHRTYVGSIERCERNVSLDNIERLAKALGVDVCDLLAPASLGPDDRDRSGPANDPSQLL